MSTRPDPRANTRGERYVYDVDDNLVLVYAVTYASGVLAGGPDSALNVWVT